MSTQILNKLVNICTTLNGGETTSDGTTSSSSSSSTSSSSTTFSKTVSDTSLIPIMKLTDDQINTFEGRISATYNVESTTCDVEVYVKIVACGDYIIEPIFCTTKTLSGSLINNPAIYVRKITYNGDVMIGIQPVEYSGITVNTFTVEGTTNSPTDVDSLSSSDYTATSIDSSYYSTFSYPILTSSDITYIKINIGQLGLCSSSI